MKWLLVVLSIVFLGLSVWLSIYIVNKDFSSVIGVGPYILLSSLASLTLVSTGWWLSLYRSRKQNTLNIISQSMLNRMYQEKIECINKRFPDGETITANDLSNKDNSEIIESAIYVLNFLEFLCLGVKQGYLSHSVCKDYYCIGFKYFYLKTKSIIEDKQKKFDGKLWEHFTLYAKKWNSDLPN